MQDKRKPRTDHPPIPAEEAGDMPEDAEVPEDNDDADLARNRDDRPVDKPHADRSTSKRTGDGKQR